MVGAWRVRFAREFDKEFGTLAEAVQIELLAHAEVLERLGPALGRPTVDTLRASAYPNMKELRFNADGGVWRVAFAFDPDSNGILLVAGNKAGLWGRDEEGFYERLIGTADRRFSAYTKRVEAAKAKAAAEKAKQAAAGGKPSTAAGGNRKKRRSPEE